MSGTTGQGSPSLSDSTILQLQNEIERIKAENGKLKVRIQKLEIGLQVRERQLASLKFARQMKQERDALKAEVERLKARNESIAFELGTAQGQRQNAIDERDQLKDERDEAMKGFENAVATFTSWKAENERLKAQVSDYKTGHECSFGAILKLQKESDALTKERDQAREALREMLEGMDGTYDIGYVSYSKEDITRWRKAIGGAE